jgi:hypothetical protein
MLQGPHSCLGLHAAFWGPTSFCSYHQIAASRPRKDSTPYRAALSRQYSVPSFATLLVLSCLHSPGLRCSCCNVVWFFCDLEAWCNLVTATTATTGTNIAYLITSVRLGVWVTTRAIWSRDTDYARRYVLSQRSQRWLKSRPVPWL